MRESSPTLREAMLYERVDDQTVRCGLCAHRCTIADGTTGLCLVRVNIAGTLHTKVYGRLVASTVDPIEKKPLYHFLPGSRAYSIATVGCNFRCRWCQNWTISQLLRAHGDVPGGQWTPEDVVEHARAGGCRSISYTYTEPTVFFEFALDTCQAAHRAGLKNSWVTNGYVTPEALSLIAPYLDAANVDLKAFNDRTYRTYTGGRLEPVCATLRGMKRLGIWLEVTTLLVHGINDDPLELARLASFIAAELGPETPWHVSRSHPAYEMPALKPTPAAPMEHALEVGRQAGLAHVYLGNVGAETPTQCSKCGHVLLRREGFRLVANDLTANGGCPRCATPLAGSYLSFQGETRVGSSPPPPG